MRFAFLPENSSAAWGRRKMLKFIPWYKKSVRYDVLEEMTRKGYRLVAKYESASKKGEYWGFWRAPDEGNRPVNKS